MDSRQLAKYFDHTLLKAYATDADFDAFCADCAQYSFAMAAINSAPVSYVKERLKNTTVHVGAAIGFPLGQTSIASKVFETEDAIKNGADEIDYVCNVGQLKSGNLKLIHDEMEAIVSLCREKNVLSKVIFENCYLTDGEKLNLCAIARDVQPNFIKTSTGFGTGGATFEDVALMLNNCGDHVKVKAAGGIRSLVDALGLIDLGVSRIGSTASVRICDAFKEKYGA